MASLARRFDSRQFWNTITEKWYGGPHSGLRLLVENPNVEHGRYIPHLSYPGVWIWRPSRPHPEAVECPECFAPIAQPCTRKAPGPHTARVLLARTEGGPGVA